MDTIAILGAGNVGVTLGKRFAAAGYPIIWGVRDPARAKYSGLDVAFIREAVERANTVFLAVPWSAVKETIEAAGALTGKILVDVTNPVAPDFSNLLDLNGSSGGEEVAKWAEGAFVVKAFNTIGTNVMEMPDFNGEPATLLFAGDDSGAKERVKELALEIGFAPVDAGSISMSRHLESLAWIWISLAIKQGLGREIVLQLIQR